MTDQQIHEAAHLDAAGNALYANHRMAFIRGAELARPKWIPVDYATLPQAEVIAINCNTGEKVFGKIEWDPEDGFFVDTASGILFDITHFFDPISITTPGQEDGKS